jgi:hypothetical protein
MMKKTLLNILYVVAKIIGRVFFDISSTKSTDNYHKKKTS